MTTEPLIRHRFSVDEYHRMGEARVFPEDDRVELIDGEIVDMTPIGSRHAACVDRLNRLLDRRVGDRAIVRVQNPVRLGDLSEPEPDLSLLVSREDFYASAHPSAGDLLLVVEVSETSASVDRHLKAPLYARHGVPELWIVDLEAEEVQVHREPSADGYRSVETRGRGERLAPERLEGLEVEVAEVLGG